jgi:DNA-binding NarL/FixJ family response regulator
MTLIQHVASVARTHPKLPEQEGVLRPSLTRRQLELVGLVARGMTNKEIAASLNLSEFTVKNHIRRIMKEVDADDRHEAVAMVRAHGLPLAM